MIKRISFILLMLAGVYVQAEIKEFTREYTYNASETDSKVSARKAAMLQLQSIVIQEVGVQVQSSFTNQETLDGDDFNRKVQANHETFAQALTKTKIIKETWDGEKFYLKAKITVDTDNLMEKIKTVYVNVGGGGAANTNPCESRRDEVLELLSEVQNKETIEKLIEYSKQYDFDRRCNSWQYKIMQVFGYNKVNHAGYRKHLFISVDNMESAAKSGDLLVEVLRYAMRVAPLSETEVLIVMETIKRAKPSLVNSVVRILVNFTQTNEAENELDIPEAEKHLQDWYELKVKLDDLVWAANAGKAGAPKSLTPGKVAYYVVLAAIERQPKIARMFYSKHRKNFSTRDEQFLGSKIINHFEKNPSRESYDLLSAYYQNVELNNQLMTKFHQLVKAMKRNRDNEEFFIWALPNFISLDKAKMAEAIKGARGNQHEKNLLLVEFGLPTENVCSPSECGKLLFEDNKRKRIEAAEFLVAYGKDAALAKADVMKKLRRTKALKKFTNDSALIINLLKVLDNLNAKDPEAFEIMVWALSDANEKINNQARISLEKAGANALSVLVNLYESQKPTAQRRMVEVIGGYQSKKDQALKFLASVQPANNYIKFAIEDATDALKK